MNQVKKILACVDFSTYSHMTLEYALEFANNDTEVIVYNVINQSNINGMGAASIYFPYDFNVAEHTDELKEDCLQSLTDTIEKNFSEKKSMMRIKIDVGTPYECILQAIDEEDIDLVVMANKGRGNLSRVLLGSSAEKVFRHSPVPVVSVRNRIEFKRRYKIAKK